MKRMQRGRGGVRLDGPYASWATTRPWDKEAMLGLEGKDWILINEESLVGG